MWNLLQQYTLFEPRDGSVFSGEMGSTLRIFSGPFGLSHIRYPPSPFLSDHILSLAALATFRILEPAISLHSTLICIACFLVFKAVSFDTLCVVMNQSFSLTTLLSNIQESPACFAPHVDYFSVFAVKSQCRSHTPQPGPASPPRSFSLSRPQTTSTHSHYFTYATLGSLLYHPLQSLHLHILLHHVLLIHFSCTHNWTPVFSSQYKLRISQRACWSTQCNHFYSNIVCLQYTHSPDLKFSHYRYQPNFNRWSILSPSIIFQLHLCFLIYFNSHHIKTLILMQLFQQHLLTSSLINEILKSPIIIIVPAYTLFTPHQLYYSCTSPPHTYLLQEPNLFSLIFYINNSISSHPSSGLIIRRLTNISPNYPHLTSKLLSTTSSTCPIPSPTNSYTQTRHL